MKTLSLLIKPASGSCNMRCRYCFYADVTDIRETKSYGIMHQNVLEALVRNALNVATEKCVFAFQGGEPTLAGLNFFKSLIELEQRYNVRDVQIVHSIQTNGLCIDDEWAAFLRDHKFLTGLSIDGTKAVHDDLRIDAAGKGTHNRCLAAARILKRAAVEFNILTVLTKQLAAHPDKVWKFFKQQDFRHIQFIPCLDGLEDDIGSNSYSLTPHAYGNFLCRIFDLWYQDFVMGNYYSVRIFDNYISMLGGYPPENCGMSGNCVAYALIEADGSVYPCDFYALDEYRLGSVLTDPIDVMLQGAAAQQFIQPSKYISPECNSCEYFPLCRGGCRRDREPLANGMPRLNRFCSAYKMFFSHAMPRMMKIARSIQR